MASITNQVIIDDSPQYDGRRWVRFRYDFDVGVSYLSCPILILAIDDATATMNSIAPLVLQSKIDDECWKNVATDATPAFVYVTKSQFVAWLRNQYKYASGETVAMIATWLMNRIDAGDITDSECETAFGLTATQWNTVKTKLTNYRTQWLSIQAAVGQ